MLALAIGAAACMVSLSMLLVLWRMARGPETTDRLLAFDTLSINAVALVMLLGLALGTAIYFEAALLIAMFGFVATAALSKFILGGDVIE